MYFLTKNVLLSNIFYIIVITDALERLRTYRYTVNVNGQIRPYTGYTNLDAINFKDTHRNNSFGEKPNFKIVSWNVNRIRPCSQKEYLPYLMRENPDIFCVQKLHVTYEDIPNHIFVPGYNIYTYTNTSKCIGIVLYSKIKPLKVTKGLGIEEFDSIANVLTAEYESFFLVTQSVLPVVDAFGSAKCHSRWYVKYLAHVKQLDKIKPLIIVGTLMSVNTDMDFTNVTKKNIGLFIRDRQALQNILEAGFVDTFRYFYPKAKNIYSYWVNNKRFTNEGRRIDYCLVSNRILPNCSDSIVRTNIYGSSHCPVVLYLHITINKINTQRISRDIFNI